MHTSAPTKRRIAAVIGLAAAAGLALTSCVAGSSPENADGSVTLKLSTFGDSSQIEALAKQYEQENPGVTVETNVIASSEDARTNLLTKLAAGNGLADVEQLEISWIGDLRQYASKFVAVNGDQNGDWVPLQASPVTLDGGSMFAYGLGTGPEAICYRADLFASGGIAADPAGAAVAIGSTWDDFFAAGDAYAAAGGSGKWYDSSYLIYNAQVEQMAYPYENTDDKVVVDNPELEAMFKNTLKHADTLSAKLAPFSTDWNTGFGNGAFATITCPSWLLSTIQGNAPDVADWNIANAFPGGGGNIGGSYLSVPTQSKHQAEATKLAQWLTAPTQQIAQFQGGAAFPSRSDALSDPKLTSITNPYFNDAPVGAIFGDRSKAIDTVIYKGPHYLAIDTAAFNAMTRVEAGQQSIDDAWDQFVSESKAAAE